MISLDIYAVKKETDNMIFTGGTNTFIGWLDIQGSLSLASNNTNAFRLFSYNSNETYYLYIVAPDGTTNQLSPNTALLVTGDNAMLGNLNMGGKYLTNAASFSLANCTASVAYAVAEGFRTLASGNASHAEGLITVASGIASHSSGRNANATNNYSFVWNSQSDIRGTTGQGQFIVDASGGTWLFGPIYTDGVLLAISPGSGANLASGTNMYLASLNGTTYFHQLITTSINLNGLSISNGNYYGNGVGLTNVAEALVAKGGPVGGFTLLGNQNCGGNIVSNGYYQGALASGGLSLNGQYLSGDGSGSGLFIDSAGRMLINTNSFPVTNSLPGFTALTIVPKNTNTYTVLDMFGFSHPLNTIGGTYLRGFAAGGGTMITPTNTIADQNLLSMNGHGSTGTFWKNSAGGRVAVVADSNWNDTNASTYIVFATTPKGTVTAVEAMRIQHDKSLQMQDTTLTPITPSGASTIFSKGGSLYEIDSSGMISMLTKGATGNVSITIPAGSTFATVQALIDSAPKNGNGYGLQYWFPNQTNTFTSRLVWTGFSGYTNIGVYGTSGYTTGTNVTQATFMDGNSGDGIVFSFMQIPCPIWVEGFKFRVKDGAGFSGVFFNRCSNPTIRFSYFFSDTKVLGPYGTIMTFGGPGIFTYNVGSNLNVIAQINGSPGYYDFNSTAGGNLPSYCMQAINGGTLATNANNVWFASAAISVVSSGGQVR